MLIDLEASSQKLIYGMSVPVRSESLPKIEAAPDMEFTFKTNTPPYRALQHDNVIMAGFQYLNNLSKDSVTNFYRSAPQDVREIYFS
jgi:hypothetical protein